MEVKDLSSELTKFMNPYGKNPELVSNVRDSFLKMNMEELCHFGRKLRNQLLCVIDKEIDRPIELRFIMFLCQSLSGHSLLNTEKGKSIYTLCLDILHCILNDNNVVYVVSALGLKYDLKTMKTKFAFGTFERSSIDFVVQKLF
jgi:hypothetical protein